VDGRRGAARMDIGSFNKEFHAIRRNSKGVNALNVVMDTLEI